MKKRIALLVTVVMFAVMILSMASVSAAGTTTTIYITYVDYLTGAVVSDWNLATTQTFVNGGYFTPSGTKGAYTIVSASPSSLPLDGVDRTMTIKVRDTNSTYNPYYYNGSYYGTYGSYDGQMLTLGYGDYVYASIEAANPLPAIPAGSTLLITSLHLGGLAPTNTKVTFGTSNTAIASTTGPLITANYPGTAKLYVYYNSNLIISKDIIVVGSSYPTPTFTNSGNIVTADDNLVIGPSTFSAVKGKSYKFKNIKLNGSYISASSLRWESSNTSIATVSKSGVIRTRKAGTVVITAETKDGENSASIDFTIR